MNKNILYKHTSSKVSKLILNSNKIRWSSPLLFNDLNEFNQYPTFSPTIEESWVFLLNRICDFVFDNQEIKTNLITNNSKNIIHLIKLLRENGKSKEDIIREFSIPNIKSSDIEKYLKESMDNLNIYRILCLTSDYDNELMWVHYSDNHYGCVLSFKPIKELNSPFFEAKKVDYADGERIIGSGLDIILNSDNISDIIKKTNSSICFTKTQKWSYEKEWRIMTKKPESKQNYDDFLFYPQELESFTFGVRTSKEDKEEITKILDEKYPFTSIYQMKYFNGKLIWEPVDR